MNPWFLLAVVVGWGASVAAAGWFMYGAGQDKCMAEQTRDEKVAVIAGEAAASAAAGAISKIRVKHTTISQLAEKEIRHEPVYIDCRHTPAVRGLLDAALTDTAAKASAPGGSQLPKTDAPK